MSYNMIDFTMYDKMDCLAESHYHKTFASYHKYKISINEISQCNSFKLHINLVHEDNEANNPKYAEIVINKVCTLEFTNLYGSSAYNKLYKGLDAVIGQYYIVETDNNNIILTAKNKGKIPNLLTPAIEITNAIGISINLEVVNHGTDTSIFIPATKRNVVHIPITTMGANYTEPVIGDRLILIDSTESTRDRTFTREVIGVEKHAKCTCDILYLDQDIDRIEANHFRLDGLAITRPSPSANNYTARFDKIKVYKRKANFKEILANRGVQTNTCTIPINDTFGMRSISANIVKDFISRSENPHLSSKMSYFGATIPWTNYKAELQHIYNQFGDILCDDLFLLTSNRARPEYLVHIDYDMYSTDRPVIGSFTWPVLNCTNDTTTVWYDCHYRGNSITEFGQQDVVITDQEITLTEIDRYSFSTENFNPVILKHDSWHTLYNNADTESNRMLLQWRFKCDVSWETIKMRTSMLSQIH